ncbi:NAD-dependent epimerase [Paenibacillus dendritiformis]|uniref:NAD-dependent epimerase/dehydratase family protein n=1 Tax=Paenibacillus dendritiformis TaxID=130049 RepID=UPI0018CF9BBF|nr:NAD-dependent epimerase/dehydratase family protein [Paenibacillus dendritiformis]MBG9794320.1 NAD-dependent epimerase [Paenibacillus dendritiformis]
MNVLVLGGNGFIGSNLCTELLRQNHNVRIIDRSIKNFNKLYMKNVEFIEADFVQTQNFRPYLDGIDVVFHLISTTIPSTSNEDKIFDIKTNVCPTIQLLDDIVSMGREIKTVFLSSGGTVYGNSSFDIIPEEHPLNPICSYGIQKMTIEKYLQLYNHEYGIDYSIIRLSNPYGKGQEGKKGQGVVPIFLKKIINEEVIHIWGDGSITRDYIHINDVVDALCRLLHYYGQEKVFNLGSGKGHTLNEIIEEISMVTKKKAFIKYLEPRSIDVKKNVLDTSKIKQELMWRPQVSLNEGIQNMLTIE